MLKLYYAPGTCALASRREFSSRVRARTPDSNGGENIPNQDNQRVNQCC